MKTIGVKSMISIGEQETACLRMESDNHNFLLESGLVSGNSHAVAYATVSYICMWLKHYYKLEWITGVLSNSTKDDFKEFYAQWNKYITKPDINKSKGYYVIEKINDEEKSVMPFSFINGLGDKAVDAIVEKQPFQSIQDFVERVDLRKVNKTAILSLILSGTFDSINSSELSKEEFRKKAIQDFYDVRKKAKKPSKKELEEQEVIIKEVRSLTRGQMLMKEVSLLNLTAFDYHDFYKKDMTKTAFQKYGMEAMSPKQAAAMDNGATVLVGGAIESIKFFPINNGTMRGQEIGKLTIINKDEKISVTVFPDQLKRDNNGKNAIRDLQEYTPVIVKGKIKKDPKYGTSITYEKMDILA